MNQSTSNNYSATNIQVLQGLEAVRKRPAMYIGDVGAKGLHHLIWEVIDNSIDEALSGYCDSIHVIIHQDNSITISDNGRGIPVDTHPKEQRSALEIVMTVLHAGGKFDRDTYKVSGGLHGVGISCVNALSEYLKAVIYRGGKIYQQEYRQGTPLYSVKEIGTTDKQGTLIHFKPDPSIFTATIFNIHTINNRLRELSFLNAGIKLTMEDERERDENDNTYQTCFYSTGGLCEFVTYLNNSRETLLSEPISIEGHKNGVVVQVALTYNTGYAETISSYVNNINTVEGGTHVMGFRKALTRSLKSYADQLNLLEKSKMDIIGDDFREGLTAIISVKVAEPQFEGQTKARLGNSEVQGAVDTCVAETLHYYLEEHPKEAKTIISKVIIAAQARQAARKAREIVQKKNVLNSGSLPGKLSDCSERNPELCELFLVEGDSAGGTAKQGRNRRFQAILPLKGKILNVEKAQVHKMYDNEQIRNIITALGVSISTNEHEKVMNLDKLRYRKIVIMTDADIDGSHIRTLILTFFFRYMRHIIDQGYLYIASPPLYLIKYDKSQQYCWTEEEKEAAIKNLSQKYNRPDAIIVQRYKGLGEMNETQLWETTMDPNRRSLKQVTIESAIEADNLFSMLMGDDVPPRRAFIERYATYANLDV